MAFEEFKAVGGKFTPQITLNKSGGVAFSSGMHHRYKLDQYAGVKLYFDRETNRVGIKFLQESGEGVFKLKKRPNEKGAYVSAWSFMQAYAIDLSVYSRAYTPEETEEVDVGKLFVITLQPKLNSKSQGSKP